MSYTYAILDVSESTYQEVYSKLSKAQYSHLFHDDDSVIDMYGIALRSKDMIDASMGKWFGYDHLPEHLQETSKHFHELYTWIIKNISDGHQANEGLDRLLEAKDCIVRATLHPGG